MQRNVIGCSSRHVVPVQACASTFCHSSLQAPLLEGLKLGGPLTFVGADALGRLRHLRRLELAGPLPDSVLQRLPALRGSLRSLVLRDCGAASAGALAAAVGSLALLQEADLSSCLQLNDATLLALAEGCPGLTKLDLTGCELFRYGARLFVSTL